MLRCIVKTVLIIVNLLFVVAGIAFVGIGVAVLVKLDELLEKLVVIIPINLKIIPYVLIGVGVVIFVIAFSGCCGSYTESKCLLIIYSICIGLLAACKIYIAVELYTNTTYLRETVESFVDKAYEDPSLNNTFHAIEALLLCCGTSGRDVYNFTVNGVDYVPPSCCPNQADPCLKEYAFEIGCTTVLGDYVEEFGKNSRVILLYIIAGELLAVLLALFIAFTNKKR